MSHSIDDIITLITAMRDKALVLQHITKDLPTNEQNNILMKNTMDDIRAMARQIVYDDQDQTTSP